MARVYTTHGMKGTKTYSSWQAMKARCKYATNENYKYYGGRGISYEPRWERFLSFLEDMGVCPEDKSLDRIDNNADYTAANCRWASKEEQMNNKRSNLSIEYEGRAQTLKQWSVCLGIKYTTLYQRLFRSKMPVEEAFKL